MTCWHDPPCARSDPTFCWDPKVVEWVASWFRSYAQDPVRISHATGRHGIAERIREHLDERFARERSALSAC